MVIFLSSIIILLFGIIYVQFRANGRRSADLRSIHQKLNDILEHNTSEKLLVFTDDQALKLLLIEINHLLDLNQKNLAKYIKTETSLKKMISNISHDLKTPLTVVLGYIETLHLDHQIDQEEQKRLLDKVHKKTMETLELINKFFDLARLESGDQEISITRVELNDICRKNILQFYDILTVKGFDVQIQIPENSIYALANEEALDRIINNLLSNAIKYGGDGKTIGLGLRHDQQYIFIDVWDRGKGIDELHRDQVFERMYTLEDSRNKSFEGSGLGLTITKRLVESIGGTIHLLSKPYEKTIFTVQLKRVRY